MSRHRTILVALTALAGACDGGSKTLAVQSLAETARVSGGTAGPIITGSGHHVRVAGTEEELTTFSFTAVRHADGTVSGRYQYNFRLRGFSISGPVTCATTSGTQAWVGGVVDHVVTDDPSFQELLGLEMWWRSIDGGEGEGADQTTGVGFELVGNPTTAASWCADQPAVLPLRPVVHGNIQVR